MTTDVIVIGGGLAGLTAGAAAARAGASVIVLESHQLGGRARTIQRDGFTFNMGGHALYAGGEGMRVLSGLGIKPAGAKPPLKAYKLRVDGELHTMPVGPASMLRTTALSTRSKAALGKLLGLLPRLDARAYAGMSVEAWIAEQDLRPDADAVLRATVRIATYGPDFTDCSADAAILQLQRGAAKGVLYLDDGWGQLVGGLRALVDVRTSAPVRRVTAERGGVEVETDDGVLTAKAVVLAVGTPAATRSLLPADPGWADVGEPLTAAVLDVGARGVPRPGYVLGVDEPVYGTTQSPPARQAPPSDSVVAVIRYGARNADDDRRQLEEWLGCVGVREDDIVARRFLASMNVTGAIPRARNGGLSGRPSIEATGLPNVFLAGDWVGPNGVLADALFASARDAGLAAAHASARSTTMVA